MEQGLIRIGYRTYIVSTALQHGAQRVAHRGFVVHYQDVLLPVQ